MLNDSWGDIKGYQEKFAMENCLPMKKKVNQVFQEQLSELEKMKKA